jgi:hypothetical protein
MKLLVVLIAIVLGIAFNPFLLMGAAAGLWRVIRGHDPKKDL